MAKSGSFTTPYASSVSTNYPTRIKCSWGTAVYDQSKNRWSVPFTCTATGGATDGKFVYGYGGYVKVQAVTGTGSTVEKTIAKYNTDSTALKNGKILASGTFYITPTTAGAASFKITAYNKVYTSSGASGYTTSDNQTFTLDTVALASTLSASVTTISNITAESSTAVIFTVTSKGNYYHTLSYGQTEASATTITSINNVNNTSATASITKTQVLAKFPTVTQGTLYGYLKTYSDSAKTTQIGATAKVSISVTIASSVVPIVTVGNIAVNSSPISGYLVAGYSTAKSELSGTAGSGSTIASYNWTWSYGTAQESTGSYSGTSTTAYSDAVIANTANYTLKITATVTDARGRTSAAVEKTITVYGYSKPTLTTNIYRTNTNTSTTRDDGGAYVYIQFSGAVGASVNNQNTIQSTTCTASGGISGSQTSNTWKSLALTSTATFTVTTTDKVSSTTTSIYVGKAAFPLQLYDNGSGTVGLYGGGFGDFEGQVRSSKGGTNTGAGFLVSHGTSGLGASFMANRTDEGDGIEMCVNTTGKDRGLYLRGTGAGWLLNYNKDALEAQLQKNTALIGMLWIRNGTQYPQIRFSTYQSGYEGRAADIVYDVGGSSGGITGGRFYFQQHSYDSSTHTLNSQFEKYQLPNVQADLNDQTGNKTYDILTSKSPVTVAQGGTGSNGSLTVITSGIITAGSGVSSISTQKLVIWGKVAQLYLYCVSPSSAKSTGTNLTIGTIASGYRPIISAAISGRQVSTGLIGGIGEDGVIDVRVLASSLSASSSFALYATYLLA